MKDFEIRCDKSNLETNNSLYGKFTLGPFLPGQGTTFGNALRRSLLAELSGLAITAFEVIGVMQEFSTLPGLRESILDLSLNLKEIVFTGVLPYSTPPIGFINIRGPAIVKASDLKLPAGIYCASPNQYIATLGSTGMLNIKFLVSVGKGYSIQPYSLYRSLSKIKLQPIFNLENSHTSNVSSSEQSNKENSHSIFNPNDKGIENRIFINPLNSNPLEKLTIQNQFVNQKTSKDRLNNLVQSSVYPLGVKNQLDKSENFFFNEKESLESSLLTFESNNTNFSDYTKIQTQIFQRINPHQVLPIDAVFTPVSRVNFLTQVNDRFETPREDIVLEMWTNGSIHPKRALEEATLSLVQNFDTLLKKIQQASSFYKGLRYWTYLQPFEKNNNEQNKTLLSNDLLSLPTKQGSVESNKNISTGYSENMVTSEEPIDKNLVNLSIQHSVDKIDNKPSNFTSSERSSFTKSINRKSTHVNNTIKRVFGDEHQAIYNLDIGNLNLSLQTFILLKKAKIHTLSQLLTLFYLKDNKLVINLTKIRVENIFVLNEKILKELNNVINHFN